jgi:hypothetical protein
MTSSIPAGPTTSRASPGACWGARWISGCGRSRGCRRWACARTCRRRARCRSRSRARRPVRSTKSAACSGIGQELLAGQVPSAPWPSSLSPSRLERAEAAQLAFDRHADGVRHLDDLARDVDVVVVGGGVLPSSFERAVHHHAREAQLDRAWHTAGDWPWSWCMRPESSDTSRRPPRSGPAQEGLAGVLPGAGRGLHDRRAVGSAAACMIAWICSRLFTLKAGRP